MPRRKNKKDLCTEQISFRCTKKEKTQIKNLAAKEGIQQKKFIMNSIKYSEEKKAKEAKKEINQVECACEVQRLMNHLNENYQSDPYIEEVRKRLWYIVN